MVVSHAVVGSSCAWWDVLLSATLCVVCRVASVQSCPCIDSSGIALVRPVTINPPLMSGWMRFRFAVTSFCLGMILLHLAVFWLARQQALDGLPDFRIFYTAGLMLRRGQGHDLYNDDLQLKTQREFVKLPASEIRPLPYNHPPFEAILYVPFTYLPYLAAYSLWILLNLFAVGMSIYVMRPWLPALVREFSWFLFLAPLAFFPVAYALMQGQDSIMLMALYCLAYIAFRRRQDVQAGVFLGLGLFKFHLVLPFAFVLLLRRRWRAIAGMTISAACELAISCALVGWRELLYYPHYAWLVNRTSSWSIIPRNMANLRGLFTGWTESVAQRSALELLLLGVSLCLLFWASQYWHPGDFRSSDGWNAGFSIVLIATFLVGYHGYNQDLSMVLLPTLLVLDRLAADPARRGDMGLRVITGVLFFSPVYLVLTFHYEHQNLFSLVLLAFIGCLAARSRAQSDTVSQENVSVASGG